MKFKTLGLLSLLAMVAPSISAVSPTQTVASPKITGDYVEARTAAVFAGGCHFNGEMVTVGRDAVMAWKFDGGVWNGVSLAGVRAMAAVTCTDNLGNSTAARKSEIMVDSSASPAQLMAVCDFVQAKLGNQLGQFTAVRRGSVEFTDNNLAYQVDAPGFGTMTVAPMPDDACCSQPALVWYTPLTPLIHRKVGYVTNAAYTGSTLADPWQQQGENSAFYGLFAF
ncbi:MAG: DUF1326 domain-containing protein [Tepidisphaeraceae bacterium]